MPMKEEIKFYPGEIVTIHSLQSEAGMKLNNKRGIVLRQVHEPNNRMRIRYDIKVEGITPHTKTSSIKPDNLTKVPKLPLPQENKGGRPRGYVEEGEDNMCRILCELLVMYTDQYTPPNTVFQGYATQSAQRLDNGSLSCFNVMHIEWVGAICALATVCKNKSITNGGCENVVLALLEGSQMYCDVLCLFISGTPYIGPVGEELNKAKPEFEQCMAMATSKLTPDQYTAAYMNTMKSGPLLLLNEICTKCSTNFINAFVEGGLRKSIIFHLVVQRLLRLIAREVLQTKDGIELGPICRRILPHLCRGMMSKRVEAFITQDPGTNKEGEGNTDGITFGHHVASGLLAKTPEFNSVAEMKTQFIKVFSQITLGTIY